MLKGLISIVISLAALFFFQKAAFALPTNIRHGYGSCLACHVSAQGGGALTPYGRGVGAATSAFLRDYKPSPLGPIKKVLTLDGILQHGFQTRLATLQTDSGTRNFPMQLSGRLPT